jgi:hypothetical protein
VVSSQPVVADALLCDGLLNSEIIKLCQQTRCDTLIFPSIFLLVISQADTEEKSMESVILWITQLLQS